MSRLLLLVIPLLGIALLMGHYTNNPVPPKLEEATALRLFSGFISLLSDVAYYSSKLGLCEDRQCVRILTSVVSNFLPAISSAINVTHTEFNGVPVEIYAPEHSTSRGLVFLHGGGFIAGNSRHYANLFSDLVIQLGITVLYVEYKLAPEYTSPTQLEDCETATKYFFEHADLYGVDKSNIGVMGDSAGGNLAAALSLKLRDSSDDIQFKYQILLYPLLQGLDINLPSYQQNEQYTFFWTRKWSIAGVIATYVGFWNYQKYAELIMSGNHVTPDFRREYEQYIHWKQIPKDYIPDDYIHPNTALKSLDEFTAVLKQLGFKSDTETNNIISKFEEQLVDPLNFPLMASDLKHLPPAYILACEYDTLRDDALIYAKRLAEAGNKVILDHQLHGWHGYILFAKGFFTVTSATNAVQNITRYIEELK